MLFGDATPSPSFTPTTFTHIHTLFSNTNPSITVCTRGNFQYKLFYYFYSNFPLKIYKKIPFSMENHKKKEENQTFLFLLNAFQRHVMLPNAHIPSFNKLY